MTGCVKDELLAWKTATADTEPSGREWVWELEPRGPESTRVVLTYSWADVTDKKLLDKVSFPVVPQKALEESLADLAAVVAG